MISIIIDASNQERALDTPIPSRKWADFTHLQLNFLLFNQGEELDQPANLSHNISVGNFFCRASHHMFIVLDFDVFDDAGL